jgi:hypothetical protein
VPATVTTATISKSHQPPRSEFTNLSQRPPTARGGVIARVWRSRRQKLNRPLRSMWVLTSKAAPYYYHESVGSLEPGRPAYGDAAGMVGLSRALAVLATKWFQRNISAGLPVGKIRLSYDPRRTSRPRRAPDIPFTGSTHPLLFEAGCWCRNSNRRPNYQPVSLPCPATVSRAVSRVSAVGQS